MSLTFKKNNFSAILSAFVLLFILTATSSNLDVWLSQKIEAELSSGDGLSSAIWFYGIGTFVLSIFSPLLFFLILAALITGENIFTFYKKSFSLLLKEQLRTWGSVMNWTFLFVLPGLWKFIQYAFVPFIVCFDNEYQQGKVDALEQSRRISRGAGLQLLAAFSIFAAALPAALSSLFDEQKMIWQTPLQSFFVCFLEMTVNICFIFLLWHMFKKAGEKHGIQLSIFSVERNLPTATGPDL